jgi:tetratricopeptide (TPR) repeat protein
MAPLYPFLLSGYFRLAPDTIEAVQWAQLVLGIATTALVFLAAQRIDRRAGIAAGILYALCAPAVVYENQILMESTLAFLLAAATLAIQEGRAPASVRTALGGLAIGAAAAGRPSYALVLPFFLVLGAREGGRKWWRTWSPWAGLALFALVVGPPSVHNLRSSGQVSFVTVRGGLNLFIGNNSAARGVYSEPPGLFLERDITGAASASRMAGRRLDPAEASRFFASEARRYTLERPGDALGLLLRKAGYLLAPYEVPQIESVEDLRDTYVPLRVLAPIGFAVLFPLALLGGIRRIRTKRTAQMAAGILVAGAVVHIVFFSTGRYRAAMLPALAVLSGAGVTEILDLLLLRERRRWIRVAWPLALGIGLMLLSPSYDRKKTRAWSLHQAGVRYDQIGATRAAEESYRQAVLVDSTSGESWHNLAVCQAKEGRLAEAIATNERALPLLRDHPLTLYNLGILYGRLGMDEKALPYLDRSLERDPTDHAVRVDRGVALYRLGRADEALEEWRRVAREDASSPALQRTMQRILASGGSLPPDLLGLVRNTP